MNRLFRYLSCLFVLSLAVFLIHLTITKTAIYGDGKYYYAPARSLAIEGNLDLTNEFKTLQIDSQKVTKIPVNKYPPGTSLFWIPTIVTTNICFNLINSQNQAFPIGYSIYDQTMIATITILFLLLGLWVLYRVINRFFSTKVSLLTILFLFLTTNLFFYGAIDVLNSHALSFTLSALLLSLLLNTKTKLILKWLLAGILLGFLGLTRTQDLIFLLPIFGFLHLSKTKLTKKTAFFFLILIGFFIAFFPQLFFWKSFYGKWLALPYLKSGEGFNLLRPHLLGILFNRETGLVFYTPTVFLGIVGLFFLPKKIFFSKILILTVLLQTYLIASWSSWNQGASFGIRMLISSLPYISFGIAELIEITLRRKGEIIYFLLFFATLTNFGLILFYLLSH